MPKTYAIGIVLFRIFKKNLGVVDFMYWIGKNKYLDALKNLVLFSALTHLSLLIIYSIVKLDVMPLNYFNILDLDLFFPSIIDGTLSQILSVVVMVAIYLFFYLIEKD